MAFSSRRRNYMLVRHRKDGLIEFTNNGIFLTEVGRDFTQNIMNVFDKYDPPDKSYKERLETVKKAKESQASVQEKIDNISS